MCENYEKLFTEMLLNKSNQIKYNRDDNCITINKKTNLNENIEPRFGGCNFRKCLTDYIKNNKYTGSIEEEHTDKNGKICTSTDSYKDGQSVSSIGYNARTNWITFF